MAIAHRKTRECQLCHGGNCVPHQTRQASGLIFGTGKIRVTSGTHSMQLPVHDFGQSWVGQTLFSAQYGQTRVAPFPAAIFPLPFSRCHFPLGRSDAARWSGSTNQERRRLG